MRQQENNNQKPRGRNKRRFDERFSGEIKRERKNQEREKEAVAEALEMLRDAAQPRTQQQPIGVIDGDDDDEEYFSDDDEEYDNDDEDDDADEATKRRAFPGYQNEAPRTTPAYVSSAREKYFQQVF
jgi:hypothetical protein